MSPYTDAVFTYNPWSYPSLMVSFDVDNRIIQLPGHGHTLFIDVLYHFLPRLRSKSTSISGGSFSAEENKSVQITDQICRIYEVMPRQ
jgi:hypothetical protein